MSQIVKFEDLVGQTLSKVENNFNEELIFTLGNGEKYALWHSQDCCESVSIEDIVGNLDDLIGTPILMAEEATSEDIQLGQKYTDSCFVWTFYKLATIKGYVTIRWFGSSNGYYSVSVDFSKINEK